MTVDADGQGGARSPPCGQRQSVEERKGARAMMTPKERIKVHAQIVRENARKLREWKQKGGKAA